MPRSPLASDSRRRFVLTLSVLFAFNALMWVGWIAFGPHGSPVHGAERARVGLIGTLPTTGVETTDRLVVVLSGAADVERGEILEAPFRVEPELAGSWEWQGAGQLALLLEEPLGTGRQVRMVPTPALERLLGRAVQPGLEATWRSAPASLVMAAVSALDGRHVWAHVQVDALGTPEELLERLEVRVPGRAEALELELADADRGSTMPGRGARVMYVPTDRWAHRGTGLYLRFPRPAAEVTHVELRLDGAAGPGAGTRVPAAPLLARTPSAAPRLGRPSTGAAPWREAMLLEIPRRFSLTGSRESLHRERTGGTIALQFSGDLDPRQATPEVRVEPAVAGLSVRPSGSRLVVEGDFAPLQSYRLTLPEDLLAASGETLGEERAFQVEMPARRPLVSLPHGRGTLSPHGNLTLELRTTAVEAVHVRAQRVLPGNVVEHVRGTEARFTSAEVLAGTFRLPEGREDEVAVRHVLDLRALLQGEDEAPPTGIFRLEVSAAGERWTRDQASLRITDLGTTVKRDARGLHVWVRSLAGGEPVAGARVQARTITDQLVGPAVPADGRGHAFLECRDEGPSAPYVVIVEHGDDLACIELASSGWELPAEIAAGRRVPDAGDVFVYGERELYRPGDVVHLTGIARTSRGLVLADPLEVRVTRPDGLEVLSREVHPDALHGVFHLDHDTGAVAPTGLWQVDVLHAASGRRVGGTSFGVEAFLPARLELSASCAVEGGPRAEVQARSLAGTSLEGFPAELEAVWTPLPHVSSRHPSLRFELLEDPRSRQRASRFLTLDGQGRAAGELPEPADLAPGRWRVDGNWTVREPGGRSATASSSLELDTQTLHVGLRVDDRPGAALDAPARGQAVVPVGEPVELVALCVGPGDAPVEDASALALVATLESVHTSWVYAGGGYSLRTEHEAVAQVHLEHRSEDGTHRARTVIDRPGRYRVLLRLQGDPRVVALELYAATDPSLPLAAAGAPDRVALTLDPPAAPPGGSVRCRIEAPFDGTALVVAEDHLVRWQATVPVVGGRAEVQVPVPADVRGGLVLSAQVTRPLDPTAEEWAGHRAYGWARLDTPRPEARLAVTLEAPARLRPGERARVRVALGEDRAPEGPALVHLWAVDEGIRLVGGDRRPAPGDFFHAARAHTGRTTDSWSSLLPDLALAGVVSRIGGDDDSLLRARHRSPEVLELEPGIVWSEAVPLGPEGERVFELETPELTGELTWLAVVVAGDSYGDAQAATTLASELPLQASLPRALAPGDVCRVPLRFENQSGAPARVRARLVLEGAEVHEERDCEELVLEDGETHTSWFTVRALEAGALRGAAFLEGVLSDGRVLEERSELMAVVRSGRPLVVRSRDWTLDAGRDGRLALDLDTELGIAAGEREQCELLVSPSPAVRLHPAGAYLTDYPHGCAEQTASRILGLLSLHALRDPSDDGEEVLAETRDRVQRGFLRLARMQTADGGVAYWPGQTLSSDWASLHVAEVLAMARELGFEAPAVLREGLRAHLEQRLDGGTALLERARLVHAAAALGARPLGWLRRLEEQAPALGRGGRASLAAALVCLGEAQRALALIETPEPVEAGGIAPPVGPIVGAHDPLASLVRTAALELRVLLDVDPLHAGIAERVRLLEEQRSDATGAWRNTVDSGAALAALARYTLRSEEQERERDWTLALSAGDLNRELRDEEVLGIPRAIALPAGVRRLELEARGRGPVHLGLRASGRADRDAPGFDQGLRCRRRWFDTRGRLLDEEDLLRVAHGDLVLVELELSCPGHSRVADVAVVDPLPGGFEVDTPRLLTEFAFRREEAPGTGHPQRVEFLDERVIVYTDARREARAFRYALRATGLGDFEHAPVQAEAMYEPEVASVGGPVGRVRVEERE